MCANWRERRRALVATVGAVVLCSLGVAKAVEQRVEWTNLVNVTMRGNALHKTDGCHGCDDATATSRQMIRSGNGYVEFQVGEPYTFWMAGLKRSDGNNVRFNTIDFGFRFNANDSADVMENGQYRGGDTDYAPGDRFRIQVMNGRVQYLKNGDVVYESRQQPRYPMVMAVTLGSMGATVRNARIESSNTAFTTDDYYNAPDQYARRDTFSRLDMNDDGVIDRREWLGKNRDFRRLDANRDGVVSVREYARVNPGAAVVGTSGQLVSVNATQRWTDTGMWVEAGDTITLDAEGSIQMSGDGGDTATPAGSRTGRRAADAPLRGQPAGILIARIGNNTSPISVGDRRTMRAPVSGQLHLGVNDDYLQDNRGEYRVNVTIERR